jgi:hypothetical protein
MLDDVFCREPRRARRRRDRARLIARYRRRFAANWWFDGPEDHRRDRDSGELVRCGTWTDRQGRHRPGPATWEEVLEARDARARSTLDTPTPCSCSGCGNPRRWFKAATQAEILADLDAAEQFDAVGLRYRPRFRDSY